MYCDDIGLQLKRSEEVVCELKIEFIMRMDVAEIPWKTAVTENLLGQKLLKMEFL